jgi:glutaredoxin
VPTNTGIDTHASFLQIPYSVLSQKNQMVTITLYSKPGCHLCDRAKEVIDRCRHQAEFAVEVVDISVHAVLERRYGQDIPVVLLNGVEIARHFVRERNLLELLEKHRGQP